MCLFPTDSSRNSAIPENPTDANTPIQVIDNNGNVIPESDFAANNIAVVEDLTDENTKTVIIANPEAGRWDVELVSTEGLGEVTYFATRDSDAPTIDIIEPSQTVPGGEVEITFDAFDADSEANISLFYDDDGEGFDGIQIVDGLIEQDGRGNYTWNTAGLATGEYYIYAMALDDTNAPVFSYSPGTVQITEAADLSVNQTVDLESVDLGEEQTYTVTVINNGEDDSQGVNLTYVLPEGATFVSATVNPSEQNDNNLIFDLGDLANGESSNIDITVNASNFVGDNVSNAVVNSNTYDPDFNNDAASLTITVTNNQSLPEFSITDVSVAEGNSNKIDAVFTVSVSEAPAEIIKVDYATEDYIAIASEDYTATNGTLEFAPGETEKTINVEVTGDTDFEPDETFFVNLSNPVNSAIATPFGTALLYIW